MFEIVLALSPAAIGVALSPAGIVQLILVLLSNRAKVNGAVYLATVMATVFLIPVIGAFAVEVTTDESTDQPSTVKGVVLVALGALLLLVAVKNWRNRADTSVPAVFDTIARMGPGAVFVLAVGVACFNPKNLLMLLAAGADAGASGQSTAAIVGALAIFTVIATLPFSLAVGYMFVGGAKATVGLERLRNWLTGHNRMIMAIVLGVLAVAILAKGIGALTA